MSSVRPIAESAASWSPVAFTTPSINCSTVSPRRSAAITTLESRINPRASPTEVQLAVQDIGDQIAIFVDGQQVGAAHDQRFTDGHVGFTVAAPAQASFSNLLVEQR